MVGFVVPVLSYNPLAYNTVLILLHFVRKSFLEQATSWGRNQ